MFEVVQVTLVVDLPRLENFYVSKSWENVEVRLNHRNDWSQLFINQTIFLYSAHGWFDL